jgi:hypothetical protein
MREKSWPISRIDKDDVCLIGIPQRLGNGMLYSKDSFDSFPSLEEVVGENWQSAILSKLIEKEQLIAWWTSTGVFNKCGLRSYRTNKLPDRLDSSISPKNLYIRRFPFRGNILVVMDPSDDERRSRLSDGCGGDTETAPEFVLSAPTTTDHWDIEQITDWCRSSARWPDPMSLLPSYARRIIVLFDGDIYCALAQADTGNVMSALHGLADLWGISIISGPDEYGWMAVQRQRR